MLQYALATQAVASNQQNFPLHTARTSRQAQGLGPFDQCVSRTLPKYLTDLLNLMADKCPPAQESSME